MRRAVLQCAGLLACMVLVGCVTAPSRVSAPVDAATRRVQLLATEAFHLEGRLAAALGQEGFSANLSWSQAGARSELDLRAPLGFGTAHVLRDRGDMRLATSRGESLAGAAADEALADRLGFEAPLDSLRYWVLGVPDPSRPGVEQAGEGGLPASLEQSGWRIEYPEYRAAGGDGAGLLMPRRLTLTREGVRLRLVIDKWLLGAR